jgi:uncharacterized protein YutE (UPF0331/DUF86 family)
VVNRETLLDILETLSEYVDELKSYRDLPRDKVLGERHFQSAARYAFQTAIQCVLDAGLHVLVDSGLASPRDNKDILQTLGEKGILPPEFAKRIEGMAGFRNILVHRYFKVDSEIVYRHLQDHLGDFEEFLRRLRSYIDEARPGNP